MRTEPDLNPSASGLREQPTFTIVGGRITPRRRRAILVGAVSGVVIVLVVVAIQLSNPTLLGLEHYACLKGAQIASEYNWTPDELVNSPYGGSTSASFRAGANGGGGPNGNGSTSANFVMQEWNVSAVDRVLVSGSGPDISCPSFEATNAPNAPTSEQPGGCSGCLIYGDGNLSDATEPTQFSFSGSSSVIIHNGFTARNSGNISTCGGPAKQIKVTSTNLTFDIPFPVPQGEEYVDESVYSAFGLTIGSYWVDYSYEFPANFGTWDVDNLSAPGGPGGGWAFSYSPCS
jgi:hypothetical protein